MSLLDEQFICWLFHALGFQICQENQNIHMLSVRQISRVFGDEFGIIQGQFCINTSFVDAHWIAPSYNRRDLRWLWIEDKNKYARRKLIISY